MGEINTSEQVQDLARRLRHGKPQVGRRQPDQHRRLGLLQPAAVHRRGAVPLARRGPGPALGQQAAAGPILPVVRPDQRLRWRVLLPIPDGQLSGRVQRQRPGHLGEHLWRPGTA